MTDTQGKCRALLLWKLKVVAGGDDAGKTGRGLLMMLLFNYHRRLRMITEALELHVEGGQVSHGWCMCVVSHGGGGWYACARKPGGGRMWGDDKVFPECQVIH